MNSNKYKNAMNKVKPSEELKKETFEKATIKKNNSFLVLKLASVMCVFVVAFCTIAVKEKAPENIIPMLDTPNKVASSINLPTVGSYEKLKEIIGDTDIYNGYRYTNAEIMLEDAAVSESALDSTMQSETKSSSVNSDFSKTNTQVESVDEADIVKTDGKYIYYLNMYAADNNLVIIDCNTNEIVNTIEYTQFMPYELFIYNNKLIVIGNEYENDVYSNTTDDWMYDRFYSYGMELTKAIIYDISDIKNEKEERVVEVEGSYIT